MKRLWAVGCDGQCGAVLFVDAEREPPSEELYFCSEQCRAWYESDDEEDGSETGPKVCEED